MQWGLSIRSQADEIRHSDYDGDRLRAFIALFLLATPIAGLVIKSEEQVFTVEQIASVIRWVSFALIVVPFMSLWRGFFQGYDKMEPTAVSQLVEQIVRIVTWWIVLSGYCV